ncbi:MAG: YihY/virulence factor BrkB family protein [Acidimicrobiales bacterium]
MDLLGKVDALQRRFRPSAFAYAVQKKYGDDRGGHLAAIITYYGFLSIFPLLLAGFTIATYVLAGHPQTLADLERHAGSYPILGTAISQIEGKSLHGSPLALAIGLAGLVWGAMGLANAATFTMNQAWNVANNKRIGFGHRLLRGLGWYVLFGLGIVASTFVTSLGSAIGGTGGTVLFAVASLILNIGLFIASFWILSPRTPALRQLLPGAVFSAFCWTVLTGVGVALTRRLTHANALYGSLAPVLGILAFLYLTARLTIYGIEANVVWSRRLWPRSLTNRTLGPADRRQLTDLASREERVDGQSVSVHF